MEELEGCDPAAGSCLFASITAGPVEAPNGSNLSITLSGESNEYVALGLNANQPKVCTQTHVHGHMHAHTNARAHTHTHTHTNMCQVINFQMINSEYRSNE